MAGGGAAASTPLVQDGHVLLEAVRSAVLAAHCAAGLLSSAGLRDEARLLWLAEATARAAAAKLQVDIKKVRADPASGTSATAQAAAAAPSAQALRQRRARARRKERKRESKGEQDKEKDDLGMRMMAVDSAASGLNTACAAALSPPARPDANDGYMEGGELLALAAAADAPCVGAAAADAKTGTQLWPTVPSLSPSSPSAVEARSAAEALPTEMLRALARNLGGNADWGRRKLISFCVDRRLHGPKAAGGSAS